MKKGGAVLLAICALSLSMVLGIFIGRNLNGGYAAMPQNSEVLPHHTEDIVATDVETADDFKLDINTASKVQLMDLPGIGEVTAEKIIDYRTEHGPFHSTDDLLIIDGIGQKKLQAIEEYIKVGG